VGKSKHTPTPWATRPCGEVSPDDVIIEAVLGVNERGISAVRTIGRVVAIRVSPDQARADAEFIVHAVNTYDALGAALADAERRLLACHRESGHDWVRLAAEHAGSAESPLCIRKRRAGRLLDGREHNEFPIID
jgi:hypothetical protein